MNYKVQSILLATDMQSGAAGVLRHAEGLAHGLGAKVHVLHVLEPLTRYAQSLLDTYIAPEVKKRLQHEGYEDSRRELREKLEALCTEAGLDDIERGELLGELRVESGDASDVVLKVARQVSADMIVLGSRGHSALGEALLGSVAHKVSMASKIPVLLVPVHH
jgi:nucleotide-binding universal stress UspA family protein